MPTVDVIIPLYNKAATIERALRSIQAQTLTDWRAIVVDDGSTDDGPAIVEAFADDRMALLRQPNAGPGAARNTGLAHASAEFIAFLDADDEFYPDHLTEAVAALQQDPAAAFTSAMYAEWPRQQDMTTQWARRGVTPGRYELRPDLPAERVENLCFFFHVGNSVVRRALASTHDGFYHRDRCRFAEDTIYFMRLAMNHPFLVLPAMAVCHHREDSSLSHTVEHPLAPFLEDPAIILDHCPAPKRGLIERVMARMALRTAHHLARNGRGRLAADLLDRFPRTRDWPFYRLACRAEIRLTRFLPCWVQFKCAVGPPVRRTLNRLGRKLHLLKPLPPRQEDRTS